MTANPTYQRSGVGKLMILAILAGIIALVSLSVSKGFTHAVSRHGDEPYIVRKCLRNNGTLQIWFNPETGRHAEICQITPDDVKGNFGARISDNGNDVTFFVFRKMHKIEQVIQYLANRGYILQ